PEAAWLYQNDIVERAHDQPKGFLVSILDHLARIEVHLPDYGAAQRHLDAASRVKDVDPRVRAALEERLSAVEGEMALHVNTSQAIPPLTQAISLASKSQYATFRAVLYARRADAFHRLGRRAEEEADRREALNQLHAEEEQMLSGRRPGREDDLWNS